MPGQLLTIPYTAVQFVTLQQCKALAERLGITSHPQWQHSVSFVSGALAGAAGTVASYPFDLLRTTLAAQGEPKVYANMNDAARGIYRQHGLRGLYRWVGHRWACSGRGQAGPGCTLDGVAHCWRGGLQKPVSHFPLRLSAHLTHHPHILAPPCCRGLGVTVLEIMPYAALQFGVYDALMKWGDRVRVRRAVHCRGGGAGSNHPLLQRAPIIRSCRGVPGLS